ncbi:M56 family metallopeptidase [Flavobacterium hydatis]|uniref:Peptidase M56, BlaR1 n=1 Tax=Flavobacterium hydatis TaxID=991 RepID=A0A086AHY9_FLAHY|nr:M56 family metallopeptidase [Flavobacterium hydatis]KFF16303.1 peptidase M56, BlaR1 [Flavobacterium hydatis]OXA96678.1 peptidase M56, BlaR1 [Flavobacterium hydatis]
MIAYILKSSLLLIIVFAIYKLWLENEKIHSFNRLYLLGSLVFGLIMPLQLFSFDTKISKAINSIQLPEMVINNNAQNLNSITNNQAIIYSLLALYIIIALLLTVRFAVNLYSFHKKTKYNKSQIINNQKVVLVPETILPHSFLNTIFLNEDDVKNNLIDSQLIAHETAHIKQKHSLDIIFIEAIHILFWFNPIFILYKRAIKLNHEFLADEAVINQSESVSHYQNLLLKMASNQSQIALASSINFQITKKRLLMMTKKESRLRAILKTTIVGFAFATLFFAFNTTTIAQGSNRKALNEPPTLRADSTENIQQPEFPGGMTEFYKFIGKNFKIPKEASKNKVSGKVIIDFYVEKDGSLSDYKITNDLGYGLGDEVIRVLKLSPKWKPGTIDNEPARVMYKLPITVQEDK